LNKRVRRVRVIDDLETLKVIAEPTRAAVLELLAQPHSVTELAAALGVPRTRLYHHIELLESKGFVEQVDERRARSLTERVYALTAKEFKPGPRLLRSGDLTERADAITTLMLDTTKADLRRAVTTGEVSLDEAGDRPQLGIGRSIAFLSPEQAAEFIAELQQLVARFDAAHESASDARPFALVWALYPSSRRIR
jgi:DNA-binding transcriptional ArsR family regulator